jgi:hypothetical protein
MKKIKDLVKRKDWQDIRKSLKGKWINNPIQCINKLRHWLGNIRTTEEEKLRIVMNYLTGTGFRTGRIKHESISKLRSEISNELRRRKYE